MKIPPHESAGNVLRAVGLLIAGMIIGAALFLSIYNQRLNMMIVQNRELVSENVRLEGEVEDLKKNKNQQNTINLLNIYVESADDSPLDKITESELKRRIHGELKKNYRRPQNFGFCSHAGCVRADSKRKTLYGGSGQGLHRPIGQMDRLDANGAQGLGHGQGMETNSDGVIAPDSSGGNRLIFMAEIGKVITKECNLSTRMCLSNMIANIQIALSTLIFIALGFSVFFTAIASAERRTRNAEACSHPR